MGVEGSVITAMCVVNDSIWLAESTGLIRVYWCVLCFHIFHMPLDWLVVLA